MNCHMTLEGHEWLKAKLLEDVDEPLAGKAPPTLLGDGGQHVVDLRPKLLLCTISPMDLGNWDATDERKRAPPRF